MKNVLHFGAGNIGRGLVGLLLSKAGYHVIFVDINNQLVEDINNLKKYNVQIFGKEEKIQVENVSAIDGDDELEKLFDAISTVDLITTAIGAENLKFIAPNIAKGLKRRLEKNKTPLNIIVCENLIGGSTFLKNLVFEHLTAELQTEVEKYIGFPDAAIDRIVPSQKNDEKLLIKVENFAEWDVNLHGFIGEVPQIAGMTLVDNLDAYIERKIFTVNTGHASTAYLAYPKGYRYIADAIRDGEILETVRGVWAETSEFLINKYNFSPTVHQEYVQSTEKRFKNYFLYDEVTRVARDPKKKVSPTDRLILPANELLKLGKVPNNLAKVAAAALKFDFEGDKEAVEIQNFIKENEIDAAITKFTGAEKNSELFALIKKNI